MSVDNLQQICRQQVVASHANASSHRLVVTICCKMSTDLFQFARGFFAVYGYYIDSILTPPLSHQYLFARFLFRIF